MQIFKQRENESNFNFYYFSFILNVIACSLVILKNNKGEFAGNHLANHNDEKIVFKTFIMAPYK